MDFIATQLSATLHSLSLYGPLLDHTFQNYTRREPPIQRRCTNKHLAKVQYTPISRRGIYVQYKHMAPVQYTVILEGGQWISNSITEN